MESVKIKPMGMDRFIEQYKERNNGLLKDEDIVPIIKKMENLIDVNIELGYLDDLRKEVKILKNNKDIDVNTIVRYQDALKLDLTELNLRIIEMLNEQGLLLVIEPNSNLFIDIDYEKLLVNTRKCSTFSHVNMVSELILIQQTAIFDSCGKIKKDSFDNLYKGLLVSTDFEKNSCMFKYMVYILSYLDKFYIAHN